MYMFRLCTWNKWCTCLGYVQRISLFCTWNKWCTCLGYVQRISLLCTWNKSDVHV